MSFATWSASSRVGHSTMVWMRKRFTSSLLSSPKPKAAVLPEPVIAWPITSSPAKIGGKLSAWI